MDADALRDLRQSVAARPLFTAAPRGKRLKVALAVAVLLVAILSAARRGQPFAASRVFPPAVAGDARTPRQLLTAI